MKYLHFYRENNDFTDLLKDPTVKKVTKEKTTWWQHITLGVVASQGILSYITLKYGDSLLSSLTKDYSPIMNVDYIPKRK